MAHVEPGRGQVHGTPRVRRARRAGRRFRAARRIASTFRSRISDASSGSSTAYAPPAPQQSPSSAVSRGGRRARARRARPRGPSARGGGGRGPARRRPCPVSRRRSGRLAASHSEKSRTRAENATASGVPSEPPVVLHRRATAGAVDDDRSVPRHRRDHPPGERAVRARRVPRATCSAPQQSPPARASPGRAPVDAHHVERGAVDVALPRVHHAAGEQVRRRSRDRRAAAARTERNDETGSPKRCGTERSRCATHEEPREREQQPVARKHDDVPEPFRDPARRRADVRARRGVRAPHARPP